MQTWLSLARVQFGATAVVVQFLQLLNPLYPIPPSIFLTAPLYKLSANLRRPDAI